MAKKDSFAFSIVDINENIPIYIGDEINSSFLNNIDNFIVDFYAKCDESGFPLMFSNGQIKSKDNINSGRVEIVSNLFFTLKSKDKANGFIPKGKYAIGYVHGDYIDTNDIYKDLLTFIKENGFQVIGNSYEEYLLDELTESKQNQFMIRVMIQVA